jgi:hypothetical protein
VAAHPTIVLKSTGALTRSWLGLAGMLPDG